MIRAVLLIAICVFCCAHPAKAGNGAHHDFDYTHFRLLPVLDEGRIKPLDSFARIHIRRAGDKTADPAAWLAETVFNPATAIERPVFAVYDPEIKTLLNLPDGQNRFAAPALLGALQKSNLQLSELAEKENLTPQQNGVLRLYEDVVHYMDLLRSLSLFLPLNLDLPDSYSGGAAGENPSYLQLSRVEQQIESDLQRLLREKGEDPAAYTPEEQKLAIMAFGLAQVRQGGKNNDVFRIIPAGTKKNTESWFSPWSLHLSLPENAEKNSAYLSLWQTMSDAYRSGNRQAFAQAARQALGAIENHASIHLLRMEYLYNLLRPFQVALALYALSVIFSLGIGSGQSWHKKTALALCAGGVAVNLTGILMRVVILSRPPVGTLYESVLFVSLICAATGLWMMRRNPLALPAGAIAGAMLLALAPLTLPRGEHMEMLAAVLNTNFWLTTHVLCITAGYGVCILAAVLAHFWLVMKMTGRNKDARRTLWQKTYYISLAALFLTAVGTALGGIWADQSWGRFWGWDPKENGALLIVLWLAWLQHGRHAGRLNNTAFMAGLAFLNVIIALAWFGVNLLNVGLHSYGFTSGMAMGLALFCIAEIMLIGSLCAGVIIRERQSHAG